MVGSDTSSSEKKILIIGLGNTILTDDGVGIYVAREIKQKIKRKDVVIEEASVGGLELLDSMVGYTKVILVDSVQLENENFGSLIKIRVEDLKGGSAMSRHHVPFHEALELGRKLDMNLPGDIVIYGIQVKNTVTFSETCSPEITDSIPRIADEIIHNEL